MKQLRAVLVAALLSAAGVACPVPAIAQTDPAEIAFWSSVQNSKDAAEFEAYLKAYPNGKFAPLAKIRLKNLKAGSGAEPKSAATPPDKASDQKQSQTSSSAPVHACDRLAANWYDPDRVANGVDWWRFVAETAISACKSATEKYPDELRFQYQLGRALVKAESYPQALQLLRDAADRGYVHANFAIAVMYANGWGVTKDDAQIMKWYRKAADNGHPSAMLQLGIINEKGRGIPVDFAQAVKWYRAAAELGSASAMGNLGRMYVDGQGVEKNDAEAGKWFRKALAILREEEKSGDTNAMVSLAQVYAYGRGAAEDEAEAMKWWRKAAAHENAVAMNRLGDAYAKGQDVTKDASEAFNWYRKAALKGFTPAMTNLGDAYHQGQGVARNHNKAKKWWAKAAETGNTAAIDKLRELKVATNTFNTSRKDAAKGHVGSIFDVGLSYEQGRGVEQDYTEAAKWYREAAEVGHVQAMLNLGLLMEAGQGVGKNVKEAVQWYRKAAARGSHPAERRLRLLGKEVGGARASNSKPTSSQSLGDLKDLDKLD